MAVTVQVAVNNATFHFDKLYTYQVPTHLEDNVHLGSMVLVPFGAKNAPRMGVVLDTQKLDNSIKRIKSIFDVAPETARLTGELLDLVYYLKEQTFCTYYEAVKAIIPYGAQYKPVSNGAQSVLQKQLVRHTQPTYKALDYSGKLTEKQQKAYEMAKTETPKSAFNINGISDAVLKNMCAKGMLESGAQNLELSIYDSNIPPREEIVLSEPQNVVYNSLANLLEIGKPDAALLHGVTSSGKTLVFIKLIEKAISLNKQALVLVPEISLTPQMIYRLKSYFGKRVAVQHSALSNTERLLGWQNIQDGEADIVVGTRSSVFAPLSNLGLIIIDEEQEHTYHSDSSPRFDAREIAKKRAVSNNALLLLASATPSVQTYFTATNGKLKLFKLTQRYNNMPMPQVALVDMRQEILQGNAGAISAPLAQEILKNLADKKQSILLLNRRGYKTVGMCSACTEVVKCESCSVPMVLHKKEDKLLCHYCGKFISPTPSKCTKCGGEIKFTGFGTQRIEEELEQLFPQARILRMDLDSTGRKNSHEKLLSKFSSGEYDIMIGTQMVAKGLDFEKVTLVGVLGVDQLLYAQGYKAYETVFSLITQVVGRGGRAKEAGRAIIQTVDTQNPVLNLAASQNYELFFKDEISFRKINLYPPFCNICLIGFSGENEENTLFAAQKFSDILSEEAQKSEKLPLRVLGPAPMNIIMVNNKYRYKLTVKCKNNKAFRSLMTRVLTTYNQQGLVSKAAVYLDFNSSADI